MHRLEVIDYKDIIIKSSTQLKQNDYLANIDKYYTIRYYKMK